jgi:SAM-dependent methyltransferase
MDPNRPAPPSLAGMRARMDEFYAGPWRSPTLRRIRREVHGDEYPEEVAPNGSVTRSELRRLARDLGVGPGQRLVDLACGNGGVALWLARETGAHATGVDLSAEAVRQARERVAAFGVDGRADFLVGDFAGTGLPARSFDGAVSIDALWMAADKPAVLREVARLLRPGAPFVFTTWDFGVEPPEGPQVADHRPLLEEAGFAVETYDRLADWEREFRATVERHRALRDALAAEMGADEADRHIAHLDRRLTLLPHWQRIYVAARTPARADG